MVVPVGNATRTIIPMEKNGTKTPALLSATYTTSNSDGPVTCYDWNRYKIHLIANNSEKLKEYENNHGVNVLFCGASKAYYIDGTLNRNNAVGLPALPPPPPSPPRAPVPPQADPDAEQKRHLDILRALTRR